MSTLDMQRPLVRHGVLGSAVLIGIVLLAVFYSVVVGAVDRAKTQRRAAIQLEAAARAAEDARFVARPVLAVQTQQARMQQRYAPRTVAYIRSVN
ncbi:MAG: hypothetical protein K8R60_24280 [Burkholderiales bacterium]|nr:hypothetical protein [Burkholderiales bacterium]